MTTSSYETKLIDPLNPSHGPHSDLTKEDEVSLITLYVGSSFSVAFLICALLFIATNPLVLINVYKF